LKVLHPRKEAPTSECPPTPTAPTAPTHRHQWQLHARSVPQPRSWPSSWQVGGNRS